MTPRLAASCRQLRRYGHSFPTIAARVSTPDRVISHTTVAALCTAALAAATAQPLALEPAGPGAEPAAAPDVSTPRTTRYAGALMLYAALGRLDLWGVFRQLATTRRYGWAQTVAAIVCGVALRFRSIEDLKNAQRADLGVLLGTAQAPTVLVLRQKIQALVKSVDPAALARAFFQRYLALEPV